MKLSRIYIVTVFCFLLSCNKYAVKKYQLAKIFDFKTKLQFENYLKNKNIFEVLGATSIPHLFVYDIERRLVKDYKGQVKISTVLKNLP